MSLLEVDDFGGGWLRGFEGAGFLSGLGFFEGAVGLGAVSRVLVLGFTEKSRKEGLDTSAT